MPKHSGTTASSLTEQGKRGRLAWPSSHHLGSQCLSSSHRPQGGSRSSGKQPRGLGPASRRAGSCHHRECVAGAAWATERFSSSARPFGVTGDDALSCVAQTRPSSCRRTRWGHVCGSQNHQEISHNCLQRPQFQTSSISPLAENPECPPAGTHCPAWPCLQFSCGDAISVSQPRARPGDSQRCCWLLFPPLLSSCQGLGVLLYCHQNYVNIAGHLISVCGRQAMRTMGKCSVSRLCWNQCAACISSEVHTLYVLELHTCLENTVTAEPCERK